MSAAPDADERRIRHQLRTRGVSYAPQPPVVPGQPRGDWWDRLYDGAHTDHHPAARTRPKARIKKTAVQGGLAPDDPDTEWEDAEPEDESTPDAVRRNRRARRIQAAYIELAPRTRALIYNGAAAGAGWALGLLPLFSGWITACQHDTGHISVALIVGTGLVTASGVLIDRRTRHWWGPLPWLCRIPLASAVLALALYAPASTI